MSFDRPQIPAFAPPRRILMGPGPSDVPERVLGVMARPTIGHLDPAFQAMMEELKTLLRYAFQTDDRFTFPVSRPGSAGMETCFVNLVLGYWSGEGGCTYHHTAPVNPLYSLHEALRMLAEEGIESAWTRWAR